MTLAGMLTTATDWDRENSWESPSWTLEELEAAKGDRTVSVVLPALNEEETVAGVLDTISPLLGRLVDELVVLDSGSTDRTAVRATAAGATVVSREEAVPELAPAPGKGRCCGARSRPRRATSSRSWTPT